jgi:hypothetical protein
MYISQDPIRLGGGINLYSYVYDTNGWVDVFGWHATQVPYGSTDLSQMAQQYRINNDISSGRNVAVFEYVNVDGSFSYEIAHSQGQHAERIIGGRLESQGIDGKSVIRIYSELEPCNIPGGKCRGYIAQNFPRCRCYI